MHFSIYADSLVEVGVEDAAVQLISDSPTIVGLSNEVLESCPGSVHIAVQVLLQQVIRHLQKQSKPFKLNLKMMNSVDQLARQDDSCDLLPLCYLVICMK